jgi:hypothetical protein
MNEHSRPPGRIGVFLVDDHEIFRRGLRALLAGEAASHRRLAIAARRSHVTLSPALTPAPMAARVSRARVRSAEQAQVRPAATA